MHMLQLLSIVYVSFVSISVVLHRLLHYVPHICKSINLYTTSPDQENILGES